MNIEFESQNGEIHNLEVTLTSFEYEEDTNSSSYEINIDFIPEGTTQEEIERFAMANHGNELIDEYFDTVHWKKSGMEFYHYN